MKKYTAQEMELLVSDYFGYRENLIVPNISFGLLNHEADLLILRPSGWAEEVEIKVTKADIKRDLLKCNGRGHRSSKLVHKLWFAVPMELTTAPEIPEHAGILGAIYDEHLHYSRLIAVRAPQLNKAAVKPSPAQVLQMLRLGTMRIWTLKLKLFGLRGLIAAAKEKSKTR